VRRTVGGRQDTPDTGIIAVRHRWKRRERSRHGDDARHIAQHIVDDHDRAL